MGGSGMSVRVFPDRCAKPPSRPAAAGGKGVIPISVKTLGGRLAALRASYAERGLGPPPGMAGRGMAALRTGLHPAVFVSLFACFAVMMLGFVMLFWDRPESSFMVAISFGFLFVYAGLPVLMLRFESAGGPTLPGFLGSRLRIWTGTISGGDAWLQICLVPLVLAVGAAALCLIVLLTRS